MPRSTSETTKLLANALRLAQRLRLNNPERVAEIMDAFEALHSELSKGYNPPDTRAAKVLAASMGG